MSKEAMKLALEALETCDGIFEQEFDLIKVDAAIAALSEALAEQPAPAAQQEPGLLGGDQCDTLFTLVMSKLARKHVPFIPPELQAFAALVRADERAKLAEQPAPAAQQKPLRDEEIYMHCPTWLSQEQCKTWVRQIEAAHGIKEKS